MSYKYRADFVETLSLVAIMCKKSTFLSQGHIILKVVDYKMKVPHKQNCKTITDLIGLSYTHLADQTQDAEV